jgi:hypothetical protein
LGNPELEIDSDVLEKKSKKVILGWLEGAAPGKDRRRMRGSGGVCGRGTAAGE